MGGSYAFRAAVPAEQQAAGCVVYYGFPEKDVKNITPLQTDVLYTIFGFWRADFGFAESHAQRPL